MDASVRGTVIEKLARLAAECAGRDPDEHLTIRLGGVSVHEGATWGNCDFMERAEAAYHVLASSRPPSRKTAKCRTDDQLVETALGHAGVRSAIE